MKAASLKELKQELVHRSSTELLEIILRLSKFKKENKELLTYLLFSSTDEDGYIEKVKQEMDEQFGEINTSSYYFMKKSMRKILRNVKKYSRYSGKKETEAELHIYFLLKMDQFSPSIHRNKILQNLYDRQLALVKKIMGKLHEDLQFDLNMQLQELRR